MKTNFISDRKADVNIVAVLAIVVALVIVFGAMIYIGFNSSGSTTLNLTHLNISDWNAATVGFAQYSFSTNNFTGSGAFVTTGNITGANIITSGSVDGVDISALLLKTTKVTDLASIWDKTAKIAYGDTAFANQALLTNSAVAFDILDANDVDVNIQFAGDGTGITIERGGSGVFRVYESGASYKPTVLLGSDTNLYRDSADALKTDDLFTSSGMASINSASPSAGQYSELKFGPNSNFAIRYAAIRGIDLDGSNNRIELSFLTGDAASITEKLRITYDGKLVIGSDTNLYRASANVLKTDDAFQASGLKAIGTGADNGWLLVQMDTNKYGVYNGATAGYSLVFNSDGTLTAGGNFIAGGYVRGVNGFLSADGTTGATGDYTISIGSVIHVKNGLITGVS